MANGTKYSRNAPRWVPQSPYQIGGVLGSRPSKDDILRAMTDYTRMQNYSVPKDDDIQRQYNITKNNQRTQQESVAHKMLMDWDNNPNLLGLGGGMYTPKSKNDDNKSWWDTIGSTLGDIGGSLWDSAKDIGLKDGLKLATDVAKIPLGYKMLGLAEDENKIAKANLAFQQDAFWKNYGNQVTAYNQIAYDRQAFKDAQDPERKRYAQETIIPV